MKKSLPFLLFIISLSVSAQDRGTVRLGLFVGANAGGPERATLRYAVSDAASFAEVLRELGGFSEPESRLLRNPAASDVRTALAAAASRSRQLEALGARVEFLFYYSGHSDENGLLLRDGRMDYRELKTAIDNVAAGVHIGILDSCASGAFTRLKGGARSAPFLNAPSSEVEGRAYLTSSAEDEVSQESDRLGASFFTFSLVSGLRGGADFSGDGVVTLAEAYEYAYNETLARTEGTREGPQHASFLMQLSGKGDLALTRFGSDNSRLLLAADVAGRVFVRDARGRLLGEFNKAEGSPLVFAAPKGEVTVSLRGAGGYRVAQARLRDGAPALLDNRDFVQASLVSNRTRGTASPPESGGPGWESPVTWLPFVNFNDPAENQLPSWIEDVGVNVGVVPGLEWKAGSNKASWLSAHAVISAVAVTTGVQSAGIGSLSADTSGAQASGIFNLNSGTLSGWQGAGIYNQSARVNGVQTALVNTADVVHGVQAGLVNIAGELNGVQIGLVNIGPNSVYRIGFSASSDSLRSELVLGSWGLRTRALLASTHLNTEAFALRYYQIDVGWEWETLAGTPVFIELLSGLRHRLGEGASLEQRASLQTGLLLGMVRAAAELSVRIPWDGSQDLGFEVSGGVQLRF